MRRLIPGCCRAKGPRGDPSAGTGQEYGESVRIPRTGRRGRPRIDPGSAGANRPAPPGERAGVGRGDRRRQDCIMLVFVGHAVEFDDDPYLVPLEGELTVKESLIPLRWVLDRLLACPARQKVLVVDVCRTNTARGHERPASGPMGPKLDA